MAEERDKKAQHCRRCSCLRVWKERERRNNQNGCHRMRIVPCDKSQANVKLEELGVAKSCGMAMEHKLSRV